MYKFIFHIDVHPRHGIADVCIHLSTCEGKHDCDDLALGYIHTGFWVEIDAQNVREAVDAFDATHKKWGARWMIMHHPCIPFAPDDVTLVKPIKTCR